MEDTNIGLSRRKVLVGLGAVGVASAGAGLGTTAFFSDEESFQDNTITAGQFELHVTQSTHMVDQDGIGPDEGRFDEMLAAAQAEDETVEVLDGFLDIEDAKPGDSYKYCWDICVKHNPGYVQITLDGDESTGNDNGVTHTDASGLLSEYMLAVVTIDDQQAGDSEEIVFQGTLGGLIDEWDEGGLVHALATTETDPETEEQVEVVEYCHLPCESDVEDAELAEDTVEVCVYLYLPSHADVGEDVEVDGTTFAVDASMSPGNLVQGASFSGDVHFAAEQCRHNDTPFENDVEDENGDDENDDHDDDDDHDDNDDELVDDITPE
ncbi:putative ribosomally synthesized peptide with SipW-like signal peptide [Halorubrum alkaliphilum]|uniref:Putative ribosomally synthesized peptide with SipW-like signal peptide n=1 Tax=Halorubrum alkaliphilum TaxID=261290 RepID=A0A8T4GC82_9EURY|nr:SipW-dependent-type signal peptide-containing protein [Halorubrum alkaliphilum]MBP1922048.1 putative ribosomally synthesized peptide with SipW-like signal peptide [Halorubrum alkaliphilum]